MPRVELLCLANSIKHGGRCVAGLRMDGEGWLRPVGPGDGTLYPANYILKDLSEPALMDVIALEVTHHTPEPHQPENWLIGGQPWELVRRPASLAARELLKSALTSGPKLLGGTTDREPFVGFVDAPGSASLTVVLAERLRWKVTSEAGKPRKTRARFSLSGASYDLSVTDPHWRQALAEQPDGEYEWGSLPMETGKLPLLTISLGEPFEGDCYKLVAGVVPVKPDTASYIASGS
jgi:hypothetical protein